MAGGLHNRRYTNASVGAMKSGDWKLFVSVPCKAILEVMREMRAGRKKSTYGVLDRCQREKAGLLLRRLIGFYADEVQGLLRILGRQTFYIVTSMIDNPPQD